MRALTCLFLSTCFGNVTDDEGCTVYVDTLVDKAVLFGLHMWLCGSLLVCGTAFAATGSTDASRPGGTYFPPPGESLENQVRRTPVQVGMDDSFVTDLAPLAAGRWALWRDGYLVHLQGDFNQKQDVASLRKTWHALTVGAALKQGRIPGLEQKVSVWVEGLTGYHADATWWHVITQTSGFDYPYGAFSACKPGEVWTYSDKNPRVLCNALARVYGRTGFLDDYSAALHAAYFDAIGMRGWQAVPRQDGVRLVLDLEDMGRLGLLVLNRGRWNGVELMPQWFVEQLERKQTDTIRVNYNGPDDGIIGLDPKEFPEVPYGFMTWTNTDGDFYPGADKAWAWGAGAGGTCVMWNRNNGVVFAGVGVRNEPSRNGVAHAIERAIHGENPLVSSPVAAVGQLATESGVLGVGTALPVSPATKAIDHLGSFAMWRRIEIALTGPDSRSRGEPNPFAIAVEGVFTAPSGRRWTVPGFFDGNGGGRPDGSVWRVRFSADEAGEWTFASHSSDSLLDGWTSDFTVTPASADAPGLYRWGRLEALGTPANRIRYLKFRNGPYWLKAGCDDPENFLGTSRNYDSNAKRMAAIDYLAARGINSLYIMTHNLDGDNKDVWPWLGDTAREAKVNGGTNARFDVARLQQWLEVYEHMQSKGMVTYLVLEDDSAWKGYDHGRYYREIIARFGHLPGLILNFNEEFNENYSLSEALAFMKVLAELDPYDHPRGIHNMNLPDDTYVDAMSIDFASIQTGSPGRQAAGGLAHNQLAIDWIRGCQKRNRRVLMVGFDEGRPEEDRRAWWAAYLGGAVWEAHLKPPYDRPPSAWETVWHELGGTRAFMESMPFWEMEPRNDLVKSGAAFCLAKPGAAYALYLPEGGSVSVELAEGGRYDADMWNAANGRDGLFTNPITVPSGVQTFDSPAPGDWAIRIRSSIP